MFWDAFWTFKDDTFFGIIEKELCPKMDSKIYVMLSN